MDTIDGIAAEAVKHRDMAVNVFDGFIAHVRSAHERLTRAAEEIDQLERQRAALKAKLKVELDDARRELDEFHVKIREAKREHEKVVKETARHKAEIREILDDVMGKAVA